MIDHQFIKFIAEVVGVTYKTAKLINDQIIFTKKLKRAVDRGRVNKAVVQKLTNELKRKTVHIAPEVRETVRQRLDFTQPMDTEMTTPGTALTQYMGGRDVGTQAGYGREDQPSDRQYVSIIRNQRSQFGRRKRFTKKVIRRELHRDTFTVRSRFHTFRSNAGFSAGLGGQQVAHEPPNTNTAGGLFPFMLYDVTSLHGAGIGGTGVAVPCRQYQLAYSTSNSVAREYQRIGWLPIRASSFSCSGMYDQAGAGFGSKAAAVPTETHGYHPNQRPFTIGTSTTQMPYASGFKHHWSDIQMVMYPQEGLPVKWHVALVSFPDYLVKGNTNIVTAGPSLDYWATAGVPASTYSTLSYSADRLSNDEGTNNLDLRWQKFWSGKLQNPINRDIAAEGADHAVAPGLPFKIIKHESFIQPARDHPDFGGTAQRFIKKLFYRREWEFTPRNDVDADDQGDAIFNLDTIQTNKRNAAAGNMSSPYPQASEIVYLAVWTEAYTNNFTANTLEQWKDTVNTGQSTLPSFDLVVKMKHSLRQWNMSTSIAVNPDNPA